MKFAVVILFMLGTQSSFAAPAGSMETSAKWLLDPKLKDSNQFAWDQRSGPMLAAIVPDVNLKKQAKPDLKGIVQVDVMLPEDKQVIEGRYVIISGARPQQASTQGWIWIDTKDGTGAFALNECPTQSIYEGCILIGSKNFGPANLPEMLVLKLKSWIQALPATSDGKASGTFSIYFIGRDRKPVPFQFK